MDRTLEPTQVAGFQQFYDDANGTRTEVIGVGLDAMLLEGVYAGVELLRRNLTVPITNVNSGEIELDKQTEDLHRAYLYLIPHKRWVSAFDVEYQSYEQKDPPDDEINDLPTEVDTLLLRFSNSYFHPNGLFASLSLNYLNQNVQRLEGSQLATGRDSTFLLDAAAGYRLRNRRGIASIEARNVFDSSFNFQDRNFQTAEARAPRFVPARGVVARLTLNF